MSTAVKNALRVKNVYTRNQNFPFRPTIKAGPSGLLYMSGDDYAEMTLGRSFVSRMASKTKKAVVKTAKVTAKVVTTPARLTFKVADKVTAPVLRPVQRVMKKTPLLRTIDSSLSVAKNVSTGNFSKAGRQINRTGTNVKKDVLFPINAAKDLANKILYPIAKKIIGSNPGMSRVSAKTIIIPPATAAVAASTAAAPAAPLVPVLLDTIISKIYDGLQKKKVANTLTDPTMKAMDFTEPSQGFANYPSPQMPGNVSEAGAGAEAQTSSMPSWAIPAAIGVGAVALIMVMKKKK